MRSGAAVRRRTRTLALVFAGLATSAWLVAFVALTSTVRTGWVSVAAPGPASGDLVLGTAAAAGAAAVLAWFAAMVLLSVPAALLEVRALRRSRATSRATPARMGLLDAALRREADLALAVPGAGRLRPVASSGSTGPALHLPALAPVFVRRGVAGMLCALLMGTTLAQAASAAASPLSPAWSSPPTPAPPSSGPPQDSGPGRAPSPAWAGSTSPRADTTLTKAAHSSAAAFDPAWLTTGTRGAGVPAATPTSPAPAATSGEAAAAAPPTTTTTVASHAPSAPPGTTTAAPPGTTTAAPPGTTTAAPPGTTTAAPPGTARAVAASASRGRASAPAAITPTHSTDSAASAPGTAMPASRAQAAAVDPGWVPTIPVVTKPQVVMPGPAARPGSDLVEGLAVRRGDSLWDIAARHLGPGAGSAEIAAEWPRWWAHNRTRIGPDPDRLRPGQVLHPPPPTPP